MAGHRTSVGEPITRRPVGARENRWIAALARWLARTGITPNQVSILSVVFAASSVICLLAGHWVSSPWRWFLYPTAAALVGLRALCNVLDGLMAVEGGKMTPAGELYNEIPDRISDVFMLAGAGYALPASDWGPGLGWAAAASALLTAYVRSLGANLTGSQEFCGPMAKPQRMAVMAAAFLLSPLELFLGWDGQVLVSALAVVTVGSLLTCVRRTRRILRALEGTWRR